MVELFLVERDRRGLVTDFWARCRHDWPMDVMGSAGDLLGGERGRSNRLLGGALHASPESKAGLRTRAPPARRQHGVSSMGFGSGPAH